MFKIDRKVSRNGIINFFPNGKKVLVCYYERELTQCLDANTGEKLYEIDGTVDIVGSHSLRFSRDCKKMAAAKIGYSGHNDINTIRIFDADTGKELCKIIGKGYQLGRSSFSPDGKKVHIHDDNSNTELIFDAVTGKKLDEFKGYGNFSVDWKRILIMNRDDKTFHLLEADTKKELFKVEYGIDGISVSPFYDHNKIMVQDKKDYISRIVNIETGKELFQIKGDTNCWFSDNGKRVHTFKYSPGGGTHYIWDGDTGKELYKINILTGGLRDYNSSVHFSSDLTKAAVCKNRKEKTYNATFVVGDLASLEKWQADEEPIQDKSVNSINTLPSPAAESEADTTKNILPVVQPPVTRPPERFPPVRIRQRPFPEPSGSDNNNGGNEPTPEEWEQKKQDAIAAIGKIVGKIRNSPIANGRKEAVETLNKFQGRIAFLINGLKFTDGEKLIVPDERRFGSDKQDFDVEKFLNRPPREQWDMILYAAYDRSDIINPSPRNVELVKKLKGIRVQLPEKWKDEEK